MALQTRDLGALVSSSTVQKNVPSGKKSKKIKDEETYTEEVEKIIQRDFFPDLSKLQAQSEYLKALETNDLVALRELHTKYGPKRPTTGPSLYNTPSTFETPDVNQRQSSPKQDSSKEKSEDVDAPSKPKKARTDTDLKLDQYLAKNTSEDNASFADIVQESEDRAKEKHTWLYEQEDTRKQDLENSLALPSVEAQAAIENNPTLVDTWNYKAKNALMYVPDGVELSATELLTRAKPREIIHDNTRFNEKPFDNTQYKQMLQQAAYAKSQINKGKIGHDGKEMNPEDSPKVGGYGFVATPSPAPGVDESPLMTWGEIEGTPFRLDAGDTPVPQSQGPSFKIPAMPKRDMIALELSEKASKAHRDKKQDALKRVAASIPSPSVKFGASKSDRLHSMSPAAQRLASQKLGIRTHTDKALRASYTPSPSHLSARDSTPIMLSSRRTPKNRTPKSVRTQNTSEASMQSSLTDNLLNIPPRAKAADFF